MAGRARAAPHSNNTAVRNMVLGCNVIGILLGCQRLGRSVQPGFRLACPNAVPPVTFRHRPAFRSWPYMQETTVRRRGFLSWPLFTRMFIVPRLLSSVG